MKKHVIRLSENDLHNIIKETISDIYAEIARKKREEMEQDFKQNELEGALDRDSTMEELMDYENKNIYDFHNPKEKYPF